ncbi:MAG: phosphatidate cytidylyltransferase [Bacteroidia bacterium]|nr:phosphatidate cytidylyltransferase [Bacteroidia bacterium]
MSNFLQRIITGAVFVGAILASIWWGPLSFQLLFFIAAILSLDEFYKIVGKGSCRPNRPYGLLAGAAAYLLLSFAAFDAGLKPYMVLLLPLLCIVFFAELYRKDEKPFTNIAYTLTGIFYTILPFALLSHVATHDQDYDRGLLAGYFLLLWSSDSFAYVFGNLFGKHRLFERISPKKSWEGSIGGGLSTLGVAHALSIFQPQLSWLDWQVIALLVILTGTLGDLSESMLKRSLQVKDSGSILPGHGGMLDRFDALFLSVPFVWAYLYCFS